MEALQYCREHHADLVSVSSEQIQRWVEGWAKGASSPHVWLGLRYSCNLGFWFWVKGVTVCYENWASDAEREQGCARRVGAVARDGGQWVSLPETNKLNFICTNERKSVSVHQGRVCMRVCISMCDVLLNLILIVHVCMSLLVRMSSHRSVEQLWRNPISGEGGVGPEVTDEESLSSGSRFHCKQLHYNYYSLSICALLLHCLCHTH
ncbi:hypothetical protein ACEWY4_024633 [Coilia grayii]|uniref:C-type lectin domain-containing protein n=1 Tax=Coilia grayii TaxID=363190 RepID=A0ABD1IVI5_9TELE